MRLKGRAVEDERMFGRMAKAAVFAAVLTGCVQASHATESCSSAAPLAIGRQTFTIGSTNDGAAPPCSTTAVGDRWFTFVPPMSGTYRFETCNVFPFLVDTTLAIYSGTCGNLQLITCSNTGCGQGNVSATASTLLIGGATYRVRVLGSSASSLGNGSGVINVSPGDVCGNAVAVTTGTTNFSAGMETSTVTASCGTSVRDVFFAFTPTRTATYELATCNITPNMIDTVLSVYTGACGALTEIACSDNAPACGLSDRSSRVTAQLSSGTSYVIRVAAKDAASVANGQGRLTITDLTPANDTCSSPQILTLGDTPYDFRYANADGSVVPCRSSGPPQKNVYFLFVPPYAGEYRISNCPNATPDLDRVYITLFAGGVCNGPVVACAGGGCGSFNQATSVTYRVGNAQVGQPMLIKLEAFSDFGLASGQGVLRVEAVGASCTAPMRLSATNDIPYELDTRLGQPGPVGCIQGSSLHFVYFPSETGSGRYFVIFPTCPLTPLTFATRFNCDVTGCAPIQLGCQPGQPTRRVFAFDVPPIVNPGENYLPFAFSVGGQSPQDDGPFAFRIIRGPTMTVARPLQPLREGDTLRLTLEVGSMSPSAPITAVGVSSFGGLPVGVGPFPMFDDGTNGDAVAGDRIFTRENVVGRGEASGSFEVDFFAKFSPPSGDVTFVTSAMVSYFSCDSIDFNNDGVFPDDRDLVDMLFVFAGGDCVTCNDIDFNNDGVFPDDQDILAFLNVLAGGSCI